MTQLTNSPALAADAYLMTPPSLTRGQPSDTAPLCDPRLEQLDIGFWTSVPLESSLASRAISLYLVTDHPLLGIFEPSLFVSDLVNHRTDFCSPALVNALLYWACVSLVRVKSPHADNRHFLTSHSRCIRL